MSAKTSGQPRRGAPKYHRLTLNDRTIIWALKREGFLPSEIAQRLGVARSTVTRELSRNTGRRGYRYLQADALAKQRMSEKAARRRKFTDAMWEEAMARLAQGWSFAAISGRAKKEGKAMVCSETLYQEYYRRQADGEAEQLPPLPKSHRKRKRREKRHAGAGRGRIPGRVDISERPKVVESRRQSGHWEGDLVNGAPGTGHLVTLVERSTRFTHFARVGSKEDSEVATAVTELLGSHPADMRRTLTFDNGKEFAKFKRIEERLGLKVYFAKPYHSWERGTNENRNGVVRRVLPKGSSFEHLSEEEFRRMDAMLNDRPMRCLAWHTPREALARAMKCRPGTG